METPDELIGEGDAPVAVRQAMWEDHEFAVAMDRYKRRTGTLNPHCGEVLAVLKSLGYRKGDK